MAFKGSKHSTYLRGITIKDAVLYPFLNGYKVYMHTILTIRCKLFPDLGIHTFPD